MISLGTIKDRIDPHRDAIVDAAKASTGKWQTFLSEKPELALPLGPSEPRGIHSHALPALNSLPSSSVTKAFVLRCALVSSSW